MVYRCSRNFLGGVIVNLMCVGVAKRGPHIFFLGGQKSGKLG